MKLIKSISFKYVSLLAGVCLYFICTHQIIAGNWNVPTAARNLENPIPITEETSEMGKQIYEDNCVSCHGINGLGDGVEQKVDYSLQSVLLTLVKPGNLLISDGELYWKITHGVAKMPSFAGTLTDKERWLMVNHVRQLPTETE